MLGVLFLALGASTLSAQAVDTTRNNKTLFTAADAALAAGFAGLTVAMFPLDKSIARRLQHDTATSNVLSKGATGFELLSLPGAYVIGPALYVIGRYGHRPVMEDVGLHGTEAVLLATGVTGLLKGALGRSRPYVTHDSTPSDFTFGKGFFSEDRSSFPSAHTAVAFSLASSVTSELEREWPGHTWVVAPVMYGSATIVGLGRMYHDKHWASDVVLGAGLGIFCGLKVVRYAHAHPDNRIDRIFSGASFAPDGYGGGVLSFTFPVR